jgi:prepilin-type N-terminal cleavage/methylation domain-containing protein
MGLKFNKNGFTLIELLIVVAIIGVLATIAIPMFNRYRINGFNSSAISDLRNLRTAEESLFIEFQRYGATAAGNPPGLGSDTGVTVFGPVGGIISTTDTTLVPRGLTIPVGSNVTICATSVPLAFSTFNAVAKHQRGDSAFGVDADSTAIFKFKDFPNVAAAIGHIINPTEVPPPVLGVIEFTPGGGWLPL